MATKRIITDDTGVQIAKALEQIAKSENQNKQEIGDLTKLETTAKDNLVDAINEAAQQGGCGGLTPEQEAFLERLHRDLGYSADETPVSLTALGVAFNNAYMNIDTRSKANKNGWAISNPFRVSKSAVLYFKAGFNPSETGLPLSVISQVTYNEVQYQERDEQGRLLYWEEDGEGWHTDVKTTEETPFPVILTESVPEYAPLTEDRFIRLPDSGYFVCGILDAMDIAISYQPALLGDEPCIYLTKNGLAANLLSQISRTVFTNPQKLDEEKKTQARKNIDACGVRNTDKYYIDAPTKESPIYKGYLTGWYKDGYFYFVKIPSGNIYKMREGSSIVELAEDIKMKITNPAPFCNAIVLDDGDIIISANGYGDNLKRVNPITGEKKWNTFIGYNPSYRDLCVVRNFVFCFLGNTLCSVNLETGERVYTNNFVTQGIFRLNDKLYVCAKSKILELNGDTGECDEYCTTNNCPDIYIFQRKESLYVGIYQNACYLITKSYFDSIRGGDMGGLLKKADIPGGLYGSLVYLNSTTLLNEQYALKFIYPYDTAPCDVFKDGSIAGNRKIVGAEWMISIYTNNLLKCERYA